MKLTITIPDNILPRVVEGLCDKGNYQTGLTTGPTGPIPIASRYTKDEYAKMVLLDYIKDCVKQKETILSISNAQKTVADSVTTDINIS